MSIPIDDNKNPVYDNCTQFPYNIYDKEKVLPLPYYTRDVIDPKTNFEYTRNYFPNRHPNSQIPARWGWGQFPNGYGYGNFNTHWNCQKECGPRGSTNDPQGYVSEKTMKLIKAYENSRYN